MARKRYWHSTAVLDESIAHLRRRFGWGPGAELEAGPMSQWFYSAMRAAGLEVELLKTRQNAAAHRTLGPRRRRALLRYLVAIAASLAGLHELRSAARLVDAPGGAVAHLLRRAVVVSAPPCDRAKPMAIPRTPTPIAIVCQRKPLNRSSPLLRCLARQLRERNASTDDAIRERSTTMRSASRRGA